MLQDVADPTRCAYRDRIAGVKLRVVEIQFG